MLEGNVFKCLQISWFKRSGPNNVLVDNQNSYSVLNILGKVMRGVWIQDATNQITSREWSSVFSMNLFGT